MAKCKVCGAPHKACGPSTTVIPVDERIETREQGDMSLKRYRMKSGRRGEHTITVKLSDVDAKRLGAEPIDGAPEKAAKAAKAPANKSRTAANKKAAPKADKAAATPAPQASATGVEDASDPGASE